MRFAGVITLTVVAAALSLLWWRAGGPHWYGVAVLVLLVTKLTLSWSTRRACGAGARAAPDGLRVGVAIPTYNEDPALLARALHSLLEQTSPVSSVTVVDDGSNDSRAADEAERWVERFARSGIRMTVIRFGENRGKRAGLVAALDAQPDTDLMLCVDSDTVLAPTALAEGLRPFSDPRVMACTGLVLPLNYDHNLLTRLTEVRYANAFLFERAAYSRLGSVLCACGSLALYRTWLMRKYREDFLTQTFLGRPAVFGDDRRMTNYALMEGRSVFQASAVAFTAVPERLGHYLRQQVRWNKSYFRESVWALCHQAVAGPAFWLTALELGTWITFTATLCYALVIAPVATGQVLIGPYLMYLVLFAYARSARYFEVTGIRRSRREVLCGFALAPLYGVLHVGMLVWLRVYALATLRRGSWGTRKEVEVRLDRQENREIPAAPPAGLEPATLRLTAECSAN